MLNSNETVERLDDEIDRILKIEKHMATDLVIETLVINAVRNLLAVLFAYWLLHSKRTG